MELPVVGFRLGLVSVTTGGRRDTAQLIEVRAGNVEDYALNGVWGTRARSWMKLRATDVVPSVE